MPAAGEPAARLAEMGWTLPAPPQPLGQYTTAVRAGSALVLSGMLPLDGGRPAVVGRRGEGKFRRSRVLSAPIWVHLPTAAHALVLLGKDG